jgi:ribose transport system substrate-binding protein
MQRRTMIGMVVGIGLLALTGCGGGGSDSPARETPSTGGNGSAAPAGANAGSPQSPRQVRIGVSIPAATHGWPAGVGWWAEETMKVYPEVAWEFQRASNAAEQASQIDAMVEKEIDGLVVLPFDSDTPLSAIRRAKERGAFIVSVDRGLRQPIADIYLAGDNRAFGRESARFMVDRLGGAGDIVILRGMQVEIDTERYEGAMEVFNAASGITVLDAEHGNWNQVDAYNVMKNFLTKFDSIDAVWASDDDMALGVERAIREAGREDEMWILGGAGMKDIVKRVMENDPLFPADITYPPGMIAAGIHLAVGNLVHGSEAEVFDKIPAHLGVRESDLLTGPAGGGSQRHIVLQVHLITPNNAKDFYFPESVY